MGHNYGVMVLAIQKRLMLVQKSDTPNMENTITVYKILIVICCTQLLIAILLNSHSKSVVFNYSTLVYQVTIYCPHSLIAQHHNSSLCTSVAGPYIQMAMHVKQFSQCFCINTVLLPTPDGTNTTINLIAVHLGRGKYTVTCHVTYATCHMSYVTRHTSHVICHTSYVIRHTSYVTGHMSHVTCHKSHVTQTLNTSPSLYHHTPGLAKIMTF